MGSLDWQEGGVKNTGEIPHCIIHTTVILGIILSLYHFSYLLYTGIMYWILMLCWVFLASLSLYFMLASTSSIIMVEGGLADLQKTKIIWHAYPIMYCSAYKNSLKYTEEDGLSYALCTRCL